MGHLNPPMLLGTLATIEAGLSRLGIPHGPGGSAAAAAVIAAAGGGPSQEARRCGSRANSPRPTGTATACSTERRARRAM